jgi:hypothetical protein
MKLIIKRFHFVLFVFLFACSTNVPPTVYFVNLKDGDSFLSPLTIEFGVTGMKVEPAGKIQMGYGHHHLLINQESIIEGAVIPSDQNHLHFGLGQKTTELNLDQGDYVLTLQFADGLHQSYGKKMSQSVNITVE